ncbi:MAG: hypothetical protein FJ215_08670 [Ignavibacteria bacterium]|nr:hypothetical protein [Ignavibacteria bacterium]
MKYMHDGGFQQHPLMRLTLGLTVVLLVGFLVTNFALYFAKMDLSPASVVSYYNGSEDDFRPARSYQSMLEVTHGHLAIMAIVMLMLTHLVIFAPFSRRWKISLIAAAFLSALSSEGSGWLVRFVSPSFAILKVLSFVTLQSTLTVLLTILGIYLVQARRRQKELRRILLVGESEEALEEEEARLP